MGVIHAFLCGKMIPKYFSYSSIVFLPRVNNPNQFIEFRPIILSNFTKKIISKLVSNSHGPVLPSLISPNKSMFLKGKSISENIMLAQEIIHQIKPNIVSNVIIKLDIEKSLWQNFLVIYLSCSKENGLFLRCSFTWCWELFQKRSTQL